MYCLQSRCCRKIQRYIACRVGVAETGSMIDTEENCCLSEDDFEINIYCYFFFYYIRIHPVKHKCYSCDGKHVLENDPFLVGFNSSRYNNFRKRYSSYVSCFKAKYRG